MLAPIALFCFRRPDHLHATLEALAANHRAGDHDLVVFADGPRPSRDGDAAGVAAVRRVLADWRGRGAFRTFATDEQEANLGLRRSVVRGVGRLVDEAGSVIVVEDDLVTNPYFLRYCDDALQAYANAEGVASVHGYCYPVPESLPETFFLRGADCWGWATWRRAWKVYDDNAAALLSRLDASGLARRFDFDGMYSYRAMLAQAHEGKVDSWAIRWHASAFLAGLHTLYPGRSLVRNIGLDASGTHCSDDHGLSGPLAAGQVAVVPQPVVEDERARAAFVRHFGSMRPTLWQRLGRRIRRCWH